MKIKEFKKRYRNHVVMFKDIDTSARIIVLKGMNGSGKSTILKAINNLISFDGVIEFKGSKSYMNEHIEFPRDSILKL